jgi:hypothetical protein
MVLFVFIVHSMLRYSWKTVYLSKANDGTFYKPVSFWSCPTLSSGLQFLFSQTVNSWYLQPLCSWVLPLFS